MSRLLLDKSYKYGVIQYKSDGMVSICKNSQLHTGQFDKVGASVSIMYEQTEEDACVLCITDVYTRALAFEQEFLEQDEEEENPPSPDTTSAPPPDPTSPAVFHTLSPDNNASSPHVPHSSPRDDLFNHQDTSSPPTPTVHAYDAHDISERINELLEYNKLMHTELLDSFRFILDLFGPCSGCSEAGKRKQDRFQPSGIILCIAATLSARFDDRPYLL